MNTKKIASWVVSGVMMAGMLSFAVLPLGAGAEDPPASKVNTLSINNLGLNYAEVTGLGGRPLQETIAQIINVLLALLGIIAVVLILVGGFKWMTAGGNEEGVAEARKLIFAGIIGLAIILSAYAIAQFVLRSLILATTGANK